MTKPPIDDDKPNLLADLAPTDPLMAAMWASSLSFCIRNGAGMLDAFRADTGNTWKLGATPIDRMIDDAVGAEAAFVRAFAEWHNAKVWGPIDGSDEGNDEEGDAS